MDPNDQLVVLQAKIDPLERIVYQQQLQALSCSFQNIPSHEQDFYQNQFLLNRADLLWNLGCYNKCLLDLIAVNSNGLPFALIWGKYEWLTIYYTWKERAIGVLEICPSLSKCLFDWCFPHAKPLQEQEDCLMLKGVAVWLTGDQVEGRKLIEEVSELHPDKIKVQVSLWIDDGQEALEDKDFTTAKNLFQRSLILLQNETASQRDKEMESCLLNHLATAYFHLDEYQTALEKGEEAYALNPVSSQNEAERWKERAERILMKSNFVLSIEYCALAFKLIPDEAAYANLRCSVLSCRSVAYANTNHYEKALEDAEECRRLTSKADTTKEMYVNFTVRGNSILDTHPSLAEVFFTCSLFHASTAFDEARCLLYKGVAFWLSGKQAPAIMVFQKASQRHPDIIQQTVLTWKKGGIKALEDKDFTTAKNLFHRPLILLQNETASQGEKEMKASLLSQLATAYFHLDEYQIALEKGNEAYTLNPVSSYEEAKRCKEALEKIPIQHTGFGLLIGYLTLAIKLAPEEDLENFGELRFALLSRRCDTYMKMNQYEQALEDAEKCLEIKPNWLKGHQQLGDIFNHLGRHREAVHSYCKAFGIADFPEKTNIIQQILLVSEKRADGTADVVLDVPMDIVNDMIKTCMSDKDWAKLRLLFIGGGGPQKYDYGKGGLAVGCDASGIPLELVVDWGMENNVEYLPEFLDELLKHGASISGSIGCNESPVEIADRRQDKGVLQVFQKYDKSQGTMWRKKGAEAYDSGDLKKAIIYFKRSIICEMEFQERMEVHLALSKAYFETKNYQGSISTCDKVLLEFPVVEEEDSMPSIKQLHFELLCLRGNAYYHQKDLQQALQDGIKATTINPDEVKGYSLLVSCYKGLEQQSELLSALNECLKRERNSEKQWKFLKDAIDVAMNLPEETTCITADISVKLLKRLHKEAVSSKDWNLIRLLYLGGGGPEKYPKGKGGIATGHVSASNIPIEDVISAKFKGRLETLSVLLEQGASVNGLLNKSNPLVTAVDKGQVEVAKILLKYNANPCIKADDNQPLVHKVVKKAMKGNLTMLNCFLDSHHPSIPNVKDSSGNSLYHLAVDGKYSVEKCKVIRCLLNANVNPLIPNKEGNLPTDCCKKTDDRYKMISKAIREIAKNENFNSTNDVTQADHQQSTEQDSSSTPNTTPVTTSKLVPKKPKKKDVRKELEELIENLTITERNIDMHFEDDVKLEASSLPEATKGPDEEMLACESASEETGEAVIQEIDEIKFDDLPWEVDFSDKFKKRFRGKKIQQDTKSRIVEKIKMLAQGRWSAVLHKRLEGQPKEKGILLFECKLTKGARILWEKTIAFSPRLSTDENRVYTDIIRVWDVVMDHGDLDHEIRNVVHSIVKSKERGLQCAIKVKLQTTKREMQGSQSGGIYLPSVYQKCDSGILHTEQNIDDKREYFPPASPETNEYNILKFYSFTSSIIEAFLDGESKAEINFPFKVTELEHAIINLQPEPPCPIILLGRSGTGKTTCCLYRLWKEFQNYWEKATIDDPQFPTSVQSRNNCSFREGSSSSASWQGTSPSYASLDGAKSVEDSSVGKHEHFHPLFITKNDVLCNEVRKNFRGLVNTNSAIKSVVVCEDSLPNRIQDMGETSWPLIVSSRDWLLLLDASLPGDPFFQRKRDGSMQNKIIGWGKESRHMRRLPVDGEDQKTREMQEVTHAVQDTGNTSKILKRELTYQVFKDEFWSKIDRKIRHQMHPTLVWTEIRSFIKGSAEALKKPEGFLSLDEYKEIGRKRAPNFLGDRHVIYGVFDSYQKYLTSNGLFDEADLVHHLHKRLPENPELPWSIHSVYVDETQDFTQAELSLLIRCCRNRNRMFFTGDTAQSIMRGIAFRFDDIKTLLHDLKSYDDNINVPKSLFQLTHNYRSHSGIIKLASSVVKLLGRFFPQSFDKLEDDNALFDGPKPVLLESCSWSDLSMILRGNKRQASRIEFGAHQAVLVVSKEACDKMPEALKHGLVLTIYEAKGLEFDDVLIYNFFKDSQAKKEWRVVTSYSLEEQQKQTSEFEAGTTGLVEIHEKTFAPTSRPLDFNYEQHKVLNPEFKLLYTAITRARVNIWFFDEDAEARGPMFEFFRRSGLVRMNVLKNTEETDEASPTSAFAESSTATQWRNKGIHYFNQRKWALAAICFTNAGDELMTDKSKALKTVQEATEKQDNDMLCTAAVNLLKCDMLNEAADCLSKAGELLLLEKLYERMGKA